MAGGLRIALKAAVTSERVLFWPYTLYIEAPGARLPAISRSRVFSTTAPEVSLFADVPGATAPPTGTP